MNVGECGDLVSQAIRGRRVLVVSSSIDGCVKAAAGMRQFAGPTQLIRTARGAELIAYASGGRIIFASIGSIRERGLPVDTVFLDQDVEPTPEMLARYAPCIANVRGGQIMYAHRAPAEKISA